MDGINNCWFKVKKSGRESVCHQVLLFFIFFGFLLPISASTSINGKRMVGYYIEWGGYARKFYTDQVDGSKLTHINYAFIKPTWDASTSTGGVMIADTYASYDANWSCGNFLYSDAVKGNIGLLQKLRDANPGLKLIFSIGGWTMSQAFPLLAASEAGRTTFATACRALLDTYSFDGIDIDWEFPIAGGTDGTEYINGVQIAAQSHASGNEDAINYLELMKAIKAAIGQDKELSVALSPFLYASYPGTSPRFVLPNNKTEFGRTDDLTDYVDYFSLMSYDYGGTWNAKTAINAPLHFSNNSSDPLYSTPLFNVSGAVQGFLDAGIPAARFNMGLPYYGRLFDGVSSNSTNGLYATWDATRAPGTWDISVQANEYSATITYEDLIDDAGSQASTRNAHAYLNSSDYTQATSSSGFTRYWDETSQTPYLYNPSTGVFIGYDDPKSLQIKTEYALSKGIGGLMVWELSQDGRTGHQLTNAVVSAIKSWKYTLGINLVGTSGSELKGVNVKVLDTAGTVVKDTVLSNASNASFSLTGETDYVVTCAKAGYLFLPDTIYLTNFTKDSTFTVMGGNSSCRLSGTCTFASDGTAVQGETIGLYSGATLLTTNVTDATGRYSFAGVLSGVSATVKPVSEASYSVSPSSYTKTVTEDMTELNFSYVRKTASIVVTVKDPLADVKVTATNMTTSEVVSAMTDAQGMATLSSLKAGYTYTVSVSKTNVTFTSTSALVALTGAGASVQFAVDPSLTITGKVAIDGVSQSGKTVNLTASWESTTLPYLSKSTTTNTSGVYTFTGVTVGYSSITVSLNSWDYASWPSSVSQSVALTSPKGYNEVNFSNVATGISASSTSASLSVVRTTEGLRVQVGEVKGSLKLQLFSISGVMLRSQEVTGVFGTWDGLFSVSGLTPGVYILQVTTGLKIQLFKVLL
jgi:chitinase